MRSFVFNVAFGLISVFYTLWAALAALSPGRRKVRRVVKAYVDRMAWAMRVIAGIELEVRGAERLPQGAYILAPKHASYGDGFSIYAQFDDLAFVTGDHLERFPLFKTVLKKLGAIVVDNCGGPEARRALTRSAAEAHAEGRRILIYPEGNLAPVGVKFRYRTGVYHMARDFDLPVVPVASSLGLFWRLAEPRKHPGRAVLEFLEPIPAGLPRAEFMARLEAAVEDRTAELIAEATGRPVTPAVLGVPEDEARQLARRRAAELAAPSA
jgi:1-acyl-sn-glycerol-3-phosphate acyltransferase